MRPAHIALIAGAGVLPAGTAVAGTVTVTLPRLPLAEYKKPYVAAWIEPAAGGAARSIFVWYDVKKGGGEPGTKWLGDLRSWWRKSGRTMKMPADGVSAATRGPGSYTVPLPAGLAPGNYIVSVEAAREHGNREIITVPVAIPARGGQASGKTELGAVTVAAK